MERALHPHFFFGMDLKELADALVGLGCPPVKSPDMAQQLDKRARQLMSERGQSYEDALAHLLGLMRQGWAAKERGL
ncbi:MAG: hypothetical protein HZA90_06905 [Verrucomicrobia bacterium]|nr:hypothetical protein [Verrucomicrobiota bacterium]